MKRCIAIAGISLLLAGLMPAAPQAQGKPDPAFVEKIVATLKGKFPDISVYCQMDEDARKKLTVDTVLDLAIAAKGRYAEPVASGLEAGAQMRTACGREAKTFTAADIEMLSPDQVRANAAKAADIIYPTGPVELTAARQGVTAIYKPAGQGPFPALIIVSRCSAGATDPDLINWAHETVKRGYVAFVLDAIGSRGIDTICYGPKGGVTYERIVRDAALAAQHLRGFDFVDKQRIGLTGFSTGGMTGMMAASKLLGETLVAGERINAVVSVYPACVAGMGVLRQDIDKPMLVLMGGADTEAPPEECLPGLEKLKQAGAPVEWHVFPNATHCWDCPRMSGFSKTDIRGAKVVYTYSGTITADTADRLFGFLDRAMAKN